MLLLSLFPLRQGTKPRMSFISRQYLVTQKPSTGAWLELVLYPCRRITPITRASLHNDYVGAEESGPNMFLSERVTEKGRYTDYHCSR
jgi:hypothetical protein